jgi:hypothetical protein
MTKTKTKTITIGLNSYTIHYPELKDMADVLDNVPEEVLVDLAQKYVISSMTNDLKQKIKPPIKLRRFLTYDSLDKEQLDRISRDPALFEPIMEAKMKEMELANEYLRLVESATADRDGSESTAKA